MKLIVMIERNGVRIPAGNLVGNRSEDARFSYLPEYLSSPGAAAISLHLPLQEKAFSPADTGSFFEGLLPEGFSRKSAAAWARADENDYMALLENLGSECLGAVQILKEGENVQAGYEQLPEEEILKLAREGALRSTEILTRTHLSLTGASGKVGLYFDREQNRWYLPIGSAQSTHIVKQSHVRLRHIVVNEQLAMGTALRLGIEVPKSGILRTASEQSEDILLATKRYDRMFLSNSEMIDGHPVPCRLHQEDFCQAMGISPREKYESGGAEHLKAMFRLLAECSAAPVEDQLKLWDRVVFNSLIGNTDCHLKNFGLLYTPDLKGIRLAPAYDLVSTIVYDECTRKMTFRIGGEYDITRLTREHFAAAARQCGLGHKIAMARYDLLAEQFDSALRETAAELQADGFGEAEELRDKIRSIIAL